MKYIIVYMMSAEDGIKTIGPFTTLKGAQVAASKLGEKVSETFYDNGADGLRITKLLPPGTPLDMLENEEE